MGAGRCDTGFEDLECVQKRGPRKFEIAYCLHLLQKCLRTVELYLDIIEIIYPLPDILDNSGANYAETNKDIR